MTSSSNDNLPEVEAMPMLDAPTRLRLGQQLQALYAPVLDEGLDPRLAALLQQLDQDRQMLETP